MTRFMTLTGLTIALCSIAGAQDTAGDRVVVPARNSTRPRVVTVTVTHGSITVKSYAGKEVIVETRGGRSFPAGNPPERTADGLKRIVLPPRGLTVEEEDNQVQVHAGASREAHLTITVPTDTSLHLRSTHGDVIAAGVHGEVEATSTHGAIQLSGISGTVVASTTNGGIKIVMDRVDPGKPLSFSSINGDVDVTLPADFKANLKLRSLRGSVWSDFDVKLTGGQPVTSPQGDAKDGKFRVQFDRTIYATINGGGTEASFNTLNGKILIKKK